MVAAAALVAASRMVQEVLAVAVRQGVARQGTRAEAAAEAALHLVLAALDESKSHTSREASPQREAP